MHIQTADICMINGFSAPRPLVVACRTRLPFLFSRSLSSFKVAERKLNAFMQAYGAYTHSKLKYLCISIFYVLGSFEQRIRHKFNGFAG